MGRSACYWLACFCVAAFLAPGFNAFESPDEHVARAFADDGRLSLDAEPKGSGYFLSRDGRYYSEHELASDLVAMPVALVAGRVARTRGLPFAPTFGFLMSFVAAGFFATTVVLLASAGRLLGLPGRYTIAALVVLTLGSQYLVYAVNPPDVSLAALVFAACLLVWMKAERGLRGGWFLAGVLAGLLPAVKLSNATTIPILLVLAVTAVAPGSGVRTRIGRLIQVCAGLLPGALIVAAWNFARTGSWLETPYPPALFVFHLSAVPAGLLGTLISPGKGLLVFTPVLLLVPLVFGRSGVGRAHARIALFVFGSLALTMFRLAGSASWDSAGGWGIRYYVPWLPPILWLLAAEAWRRRGWPGRWTRVAGALIAMGIAINLSALVTSFHYRQQVCGYERWSLSSANACAVAALPANLARVAGARVPEVVLPHASPANVFVSNRLALWWYAIRVVGVSPVVSWAIAASLLLFAAAFWRLGRLLEDGVGVRRHA